MVDKKWLSKKVVILGAPAVGKTSLINRFVHHKFSEQYLSTIGLNIVKKTIKHESYTLDLVLWEIAGQEKLIENYLKSGEGVIIVVDISSTQYDAQIKQFTAIMDRVAPNAVSIIVGNKLDLLSPEQLAEVQQSFASYTHTAFFFSSAKTGENVEAFFQDIGYKLIEKYKEQNQ